MQLAVGADIPVSGAECPGTGHNSFICKQDVYIPELLQRLLLKRFWGDTFIQIRVDGDEYLGMGELVGGIK